MSTRSATLRFCPTGVERVEPEPLESPLIETGLQICRGFNPLARALIDRHQQFPLYFSPARKENLY